MSQNTRYISLLYKIVLLSLLYLPLKTAAQCNITASSNGCVDEIISFKVTAGQSITSYSWDFGDGGTSQQPAPGYKYSANATRVVKVTITLLDGTSCTATHNITIHPKPVSSFAVASNSSYCFYKNKVCVNDNSTPGPTGNPIVQRVFLWDDGAGDNSNNPSAQKNFCHTYLQTGVYTMLMETTDDKGCQAKSTQKITILPDYDAKFNSKLVVNPVNCRFSVCFDNTTVPTDTINITSYMWDFGDGQTTSDFKDFRRICHDYSTSGNYTARLIVTHKSGCSDSMQTPVTILKPNILFNLKIPKVVCLGTTAQLLNDTANPFAQYRWFIRDSATGQERPMSGGLTNPFNYTFDNPGKYIIKLNILRDSCQQNGYDTIIVKCPKADFDALNKSLCKEGDTTYFCNKSCYYQSYNHTWLWDFHHGDACTTDTKNGLNTTRNCRYSVDENSKHYFSFIDSIKPYSCFEPQLFIKDTVTGCENDSKTGVLLGMPPLDSLKIDHFAIDYCTDIGSPNPERDVVFYISGLSCNQNWRMYLLYDSADVTSSFQKVVAYPPPVNSYKYTADPFGNVTIGFRVENGANSAASSCHDPMPAPSTTCADTVWYHHKFNIATVPNPKVSNYIDKGCAPLNLTVRPDDTVQYGVKKIWWDWGDGTVDSLEMAPTDSIIPVRYHTYWKNGLYTAQLTMTNYRDCGETDFLLIGLGYDNFVDYDSIVCAGDSVELKEYLSYYDNAAPFWTDSARLAQPNKEKLYWDFDDGKGFVTKKHETKAFFPSVGTYHVRMASEDSTGCKDTFEFDIIAVQADAYIRRMADTFYCNDNIIRFYDSSFGSPQIPGDVVKEWNWNFGDAKNNSFLRDPYHFYSSFGEKLVTLIIKSEAGCLDTAYKILQIVGPVPKFEFLVDSVGCDPLKIELKNTSERVSTWIWSMGDPAKTTISTDKDTIIKFTYTPPGTYYINLYGADSIYNPNTGNTYFCASTYPDTPLVKQVVVIPNYPVGYDIPDIICVGNPFTVKSVSATRYDDFRWWMGNGDSIFTDTFQFQYTYQKEGNYRIDFKPTYAPGPWERLCIADTFKDITVIPIRADFDIDPNSTEPLYRFINKSTNAVRYEWDFGHQASGKNNFSQLKDPSHNYKIDLGTFTVCLRAFNKEGCVDTICKTVQNNYAPRLFIPNVFTPQGMDTLNSRFDIDIYRALTYQLSIYNRWGEKVFESFDDGEGNSDARNWDGHHYKTGTLCPAGVYYVVFDYEILGLEKRESYSGTLTLFRED